MNKNSNFLITRVSSKLEFSEKILEYLDSAILDKDWENVTSNLSISLNLNLKGFF